jgi:hypothetical protein
LRESQTYSVLPDTYRKAWLDACSKQLEDRCAPPKDGDIFEELPGEVLSHKIRDRLNDYGLIAGIEFTIGKNRRGVSIEVICKHFGEETTNKRGLKDKVVRRDEEGQIISDRKRNKDDRRTGYKVRYPFYGRHLALVIKRDVIKKSP